MRAVLGLVAAALLFATGCSSAPQVGDGHLGVDWAVLPTPSVPVPPVGECTDSAADGPQKVGWTLAFLPGTAVDCGHRHLTETFFVGTFPDTSDDTAPALGSTRFRSATTTCLAQATDFLGRDPHTSALAVVAVAPSDRQWAGSARWFRCEAMQVAGLEGTIVARTDSLAGALTGSGPLATTCADVMLTADHTVVLSGTYTSCERAHDVELTGSYTVPDAGGDYPDASTLATLIGAGCRAAGAAYVGVSLAALLPARGAAFGFALPLSEEQWSAGERTTSCFYGSYSKRRTGSVKATGKYPY
jgi:hypothetical protein